MRSMLVCYVCLTLQAPFLAGSTLTSEAALSCIQGMSGNNTTLTRNLTLALAGGRDVAGHKIPPLVEDTVVSGQTIGPLVEGTNFSLACCARRSKRRVAQLEWWHNISNVVSQEKLLIDDIAVSTIDITNVTMSNNGIKFTCRGARAVERSVILLVTGPKGIAEHQGGTTAGMMVLVFIGMIFALPFLIIFLRAKKGMGTM